MDFNTSFFLSQQQARQSFCNISLIFPEFFDFLIFENQSAAENGIQLIIRALCALHEETIPDPQPRKDMRSKGNRICNRSTLKVFGNKIFLAG